MRPCFANPFYRSRSRRTKCVLVPKRRRVNRKTTTLSTLKVHSRMARRATVTSALRLGTGASTKALSPGQWRRATPRDTLVGVPCSVAAAKNACRHVDASSSAALPHGHRSYGAQSSGGEDGGAGGLSWKRGRSCELSSDRRRQLNATQPTRGGGGLSRRSVHGGPALGSEYLDVAAAQGRARLKAAALAAADAASLGQMFVFDRRVKAAQRVKPHTLNPRP